MNLDLADWAIFVAVYVGLFAGGAWTKRHVKSVADFLAAGRTAEPQINPVRIKRGKRAKLFRNDQRRMIWQHDAAGANANC